MDADAMDGKHILVCGGREFTDCALVCKTLDGLLAASTLPPSDTVIIHSDALGADRLAGQWALPSCNRRLLRYTTR